jgi:hypothetical protein
LTPEEVESQRLNCFESIIPSKLTSTASSFWLPILSALVEGELLASLNICIMENRLATVTHATVYVSCKRERNVERSRDRDRALDRAGRLD